MATNFLWFDDVAWSSFPAWFLPAVAGNITGGVGMVTILEYGQVIAGKDEG